MALCRICHIPMPRYYTSCLDAYKIFLINSRLNRIKCVQLRSLILAFAPMDHAIEISATLLNGIVRRYVELLSEFKEPINRLNVYPVPDGDTGSNLYLTLVAVLKELESTPEASSDLSICCKAISKGALMGARGNSGVIFSQIARGFAEGVTDSAAVDSSITKAICSGLVKASKLADGAVLRPVEGTILTVARKTAEAASTLYQRRYQDAVEVLRQVASDALLDTPNQLRILRQANVVDAGGAGFVLFIDAIAQILNDSTQSGEYPWFGYSPVESPNEESLDGGNSQEYRDISDLKYEVMFLLEASEQAVAGFREVWAGIGDSIVIVGQDDLWNCHIHTDDIGAAIEAAIEAGKPKNIRVTDLSEQVAEEGWVTNAHGSGAPDPLGAPEFNHNTGVIAVANGGGVGRIFRSMGVNRIVFGGQSMNPSTAEILAAIDELQVNQVIILPNNSNIIPVAKMAADMSDRDVKVLPTKGVIEGFSALLEFDPAATAEENYPAMLRSATKVSAGEITQAVRNSSWVDGTISKGDYLGIGRDGIVAVEKDIFRALQKLLLRLITPDSELVTLIEGEGSGAGITREITEWLSDIYPNLEIEIHHGGQPLYPYLVGVE